MKILDRKQFEISLASDTSLEEYDNEPVVLSYTKDYLIENGICDSTIFDGVRTVVSFGLLDFTLVEKDAYFEYYKYDEFTLDPDKPGQPLEVWHYSNPLHVDGPCDCGATVMVSCNGETFYCCEQVFHDEEAFRIFIAGILYPSIGSVDTSNQCLKKAYEAIHRRG